MSNEEKMRLEGYLLDHGVSAVQTGMINNLAEAFEGDLQSFLSLNKGELLAIYNRIRPGSKKQPSEGTFETIKLARQGLVVMRKSDNASEAAAKVSLDSAIEQAKNELRVTVMAQELKVSRIMATMSALETLGYKDSFELGLFLDIYGRVKEVTK